MKRNFFWLGAFHTVVFTMFAQVPSQSPSAGDFDVIVRGGTVYDGTGGKPRQADVAIRGDRIAGVGDFKAANAKTVIDAKGTRGRARVHQHAFVVDRIADRGWPFTK